MTNQLKHFIILAKALAKAYFKIESENKILGFAWNFLNPLLVFLILWLIFSNATGQNIEKFPAYLIIGVVIFNFFMNSTNNSLKYIKDNRIAIKMISFPKEALAGGAILYNTIIHIFEIFIIAILLIYLQTNPINLIYYIPIFIFLVIFTYGASLLVASLIVILSDIENIWHHVARLLWFATPIFYTISTNTLLYKLNFYFNPMFHFIDTTRDIVVYNQAPTINSISIIIIYSLALFLIGSLLFYKTSKKLPEVL